MYLTMFNRGKADVDFKRMISEILRFDFEDFECPCIVYNTPLCQLHQISTLNSYDMQPPFIIMEDDISCSTCQIHSNNLIFHPVSDVFENKFEQNFDPHASATRLGFGEAWTFSD